jgi:mono/diheme cytochrome c family protein
MPDSFSSNPFYRNRINYAGKVFFWSVIITAVELSSISRRGVLVRTILKILGMILGVLVVAAAAGIAYLFIRYPRTEPPPDIKVVSSPEALERGQYLATHVSGCIACHSERDRSLYSEPLIAGTEGKGGLFAAEGPLVVYAPNLTPYHLGNWSDGEIARAVTTGVTKDGSPLFPIMPYLLFSEMTEQDLTSIIAYLRTLSPITSDPPRSKFGFPLNLIMRTIPRPAPINREPVADRGRYLTRIAVCIECHTPVDEHNQAIPGREFSGGHDFGNVTSANITPDVETGIGKWSKEQFIKRFKAYEAPEMRNIRLQQGAPNTVMPWTMYSGMSEEDLSAIYDYLRTVKPIHNAVVHFRKTAPQQ